MEWDEIAAQLRDRLEQMAGHGMGYLSVPAEPSLAQLLHAAAAQAKADQSSAPHGGRGRAAGVAATLRGDAAARPDAGLAHPPPPSGAVAGPAVPPPPSGAVAGPADPPPPLEEVESLERLAYVFRDCQACGLGATRTRLVFGTGHARPRLMFIGEGPGADEDQQGLPFVGKAGGVLTVLITALGLVRDDVYITNVVKCRPPDNRNPEPEEMAACRPILHRQIELLDPALIVTLGNVPLKQFRPEAGGITKERGREFTFQRWRVLPTYHPSYLLRNPAAVQDCWRDFKLALALAGGDGDA